MTAKPVADLLITHAHLVTVAGASRYPDRGAQMDDIGVITDGAVAAREGSIIAVGTTSEVTEQVEITPSTRVLDLMGKVVTPGLVDSHTHVIFAGSQENELELKLRGMGYLDILKAGGGILNTVRATRAAEKDELARTGSKYLDEMLAQGTTTAEAKSGCRSQKRVRVNPEG